MYNFNYKSGNLIGRICYEVSLKPFKSFETEAIKSVCRKMFDGWIKLSDKSESIAVMLWTADGSEILDYSGNLDEDFDYCDLIGIGNPTKKPPYTEAEKNDLHVRPVPYNGERKKISYRILANIVSCIKSVGKEVTGKEIKVIETFDPGPEFAKSEFKYARHTELNKGNTMGEKQWLHCAALLHAENRRYAAYPNGIPEGTNFGEFLGRQFMMLSRDVGFDSIWLSNGFGFSLNSWSWKGEVFDGEKFDNSGAAAVKNSINEFWHCFTAEMSDRLIEVRGSNLSTAMDISAHGCPIDDIYENNILTPPNSPWAAIDSRFGLELCGYLSHIAETSQKGYLFRYYTHDPWWYNSPWFDRYGRSPHDIYLPLATARLDGDGNITPIYGVNLLSVDDSFGNMPEKCPNEVIPHLLEAFDTYSDEPGLVTWIYPFTDYCEMGLKKARQQDIFMDDWFMESAIDYGFPVNTVISEKNFLSCNPKKFEETVLVSPVPFADSLLEKCIIKAVENNLRVILFGGTEKASEQIRKTIGVQNIAPISGELKLVPNFKGDTYTDGELSDKLLHNPLVSGGSISEAVSDDGTAIIASALDGTDSRAYATYNDSKKVAWVRGSFPHYPKWSMPPSISPEEAFPTGSILRYLLSTFDINIRYTAMYPTDKLPVNLFSRHDRAYYFTCFAKDTSISMSLSFPMGVPVPEGSDAVIENNIGNMTLSGSCHSRCRVFVRQAKRSKVSCRIETASDTMVADGRVSVIGLKDADVTFYPPENSIVYCTDGRYKKSDSFRKADIYNSDGSVTFKNVTGECFILWQDKDTEKKYRETGYIL